MRCILLVVLFASLVNAAYGQNSASDRYRYVRVPDEQGVILIAAQADCPLKFEDVKLLSNMKGLWVPHFKLRNQGTKPIRAFMVAAAGNGEWGWEASDSTHYIKPDQFAPWDGNSKADIIPLTESLRDRLNLRGEMKGVLALVVVRVEFVDGSSFTESAYAAMKDYFEKIYFSSRKRKGD